MAAGAGRRMGGKPKALLLRDGVPLIERHLRVLAQAGIRHAVVVLGHHAARIEPILRALQTQLAEALELRWALNPQPDDGPGSSLRTGLAALPSELSAVLVALADQPLIDGADMEAVLAAWMSRAPNAHLVVPCFEGQPGHPLVFAAGVRAGIMEMKGAAGLRDWRKVHPDQVEAWQVDHPRYTLDVDSEADRAALKERYGIALMWPEDLAGSAAPGA